MITPDYCRTLAAYNRWANATLYDRCAALTDDERRRDLGAPFGSVHATLNHLLYGDRSWLGRFTGRPYAVTDIGQELYADFGVLRREREATDGDLAEWAEAVSPEWLAAPFTYTSNVDRVTRTFPAWLLVVHFFNHQTYHRGQITALLARLGYEHGVYDLPWMPRTQ
jgi:uncharacterized damage-inducible protein DinB